MSARRLAGAAALALALLAVGSGDGARGAAGAMPEAAPSRPAAAPANAATGHVNRLRVAGTINPATVDYLRHSLARSEADGARALVFEIDTPGGLLQATRSIVQDILGSRVPVLTYVSPSGAGAGSAGVFIVMAGDVAAMAPGTSIGASTPVQAGGGELHGAMGRKVKNFTAAFAKGIAEQRGRNVEWAERAVRNAATATDREALQLHVIDLVAPSVEDLLAQASGREVSAGGVKQRLELRGLPLVDLPMSLRQRVIDLLADPNVSYLFMLAGLLGLYLELTHPGTFLPGVTGGICLLIALASFQVLPINQAGVGLLLLGIAMLVAELFLPSFGVVGVGGIVAFVLGSIFLFDADEPGLAVDRWLIGSAAAAVGVVMLALATLVVRSMRKRPAMGREGLIGAIGEVRARIAPRGTVFVGGELWRARAAQPIGVGEVVRVTRVEGLTLWVEPAGEGRGR